MLCANWYMACNCSSTKDKLYPTDNYNKSLSIKCPDSVIGRIKFLFWLIPDSSVLCLYFSIYHRKTKQMHEKTKVKNRREDSASGSGQQTILVISFMAVILTRDKS